MDVLLLDSLSFFCVFVEVFVPVSLYRRRATPLTQQVVAPNECCVGDETPVVNVCPFAVALCASFVVFCCCHVCILFAS